MKRTLAITAVTALLALSLTACGADGDMPGTSSTAGGTTATDTMHSNQAGTGMTDGATANTDTAINGLGTVTGAINSGREPTRYGMTNRDAYGAGTDAYTATNNGGVTVDYSDELAVRRAAAAGDRMARMLENGRVHDSDGWLFDGENSNYRTY
ncbi:MAG: hypothetical protein IKN81_03050 [Oscillospiraceae bacterium]|nr:hypothetical protein [Oscillospiraceae bacterium]